LAPEPTFPDRFFRKKKTARKCALGRTCRAGMRAAAGMHDPVGSGTFDEKR
jgi:hypothetical protein